MIRLLYNIHIIMELLVEKFDKLIEEKNKEIEKKYLLKTKKIATVSLEDIKEDDTDTNVIVVIDNKDTIDYTTKKTIYKINAELDRKYKSSKLYKNLQAYSI